MLGITKTSSGRLGNRLFHYHLLRQLAARSAQEYFHSRLPDSRYFEEMEKRPRPWTLLRHDRKLTSSELTALGPEKVINLIAETKDRDIVLTPPILGEAFFDFLFFPPAQFIKVKPEYQIPFPFPTAARPLIGLHFRGTDFESWNSRASLKPAYYQAAITKCLEHFSDSSPIFILFTDDLKFMSYLQTIEYLKNKRLDFQLSQNLKAPIVDFYQLSQCDVIVSSPSTFAILAGAIGKPKKIIHDKGWLDYSLNRNDAFWIKLSQSSSPYYSLWQSL